MERFKLLGSTLSYQIKWELEDRIHKDFLINRNYLIAEHLYEKLQDRLKRSSIKDDTNIQSILTTTLGNYQIIEVHNLKGTLRVLVRSIDIVGTANACFVLDLDKKTVVTCYFNRNGDTHDTLDVSKYFGKYTA